MDNRFSGNYLPVWWYFYSWSRS